MEIPGLGFVMRVFGAFPVKLEAPGASAHRAANEAILGGKALVIFPEGGRTPDGTVQQFKMGAFRLALNHGVPIVPVTIRGADGIWPVGRLLPRPGRLAVTYHPPISIERVPSSLPRLELKERARVVAHRTRDIVASGLRTAGIPDPGDADHRSALEANI